MRSPINTHHGSGLVSCARALPGGAAFVRAALNNIGATGQNDIYTVPSGKIALIGRARFYNNNGSNATVSTALKIAGTYYRQTGNATCSANAATSASPAIVAPSGSTFAVATSLTSVNAWLDILELDAECGIIPIAATSFSSGDNVIYTCPPRKSATLVDLNSFGQVLIGGGLRYVNNSGGSATFKFYQVNSGDSTSTSNLIAGAQSATNDSVNNGTSVSTMSAGDQIVLNTSVATAGQGVFSAVLETPL